MPSPDRRSPSAAPFGRVGMVIALGFVELLTLSFAVDVRTTLGELGLAFFPLGRIGPFIGAVAAGAALFVGLPSLRESMGSAGPDVGAVRLQHWLLHLALFAGCLATASTVFNPADPSAVAVSLWMGLATATVMAGLRLVGPWSSLVAAVQPHARNLGAGMVLGAAAYAVGSVSESHWAELAGLTLHMSHALLAMVHGDVFVDVDYAIIGLADFSVEIAPQCSGAEGMGLMAVFVLAYLALRRRAWSWSTWVLVFFSGVGLAWLANSFRIAALVAVGQHLSPEIAVSGFHAKAGSVLFCVVALGFLSLLERSGEGAADDPTRDLSGEDPPAYLLPLMAVVGTAMVTGLFATGFDAAYGLRAVAGLSVVAATGAMRLVRPIRPTGWAIAVGVLVFFLWVPLLARPSVQAQQAWASQLQALPDGWRQGWIAVRLLGAVVVIPLVEELAFRGFLLQRILQPDVFGRLRRPLAVAASLLVTSLAFGMLHQAIVAGTLAGAAYGGLMLWRGRLGEVVWAHATTNLLVAIAAVVFDMRWLWM